MGLKVITIILVLIFNVITFLPASAYETDNDSDFLTGIWQNLNYRFHFNKPNFSDIILNNKTYYSIEMTDCITLGKKAGEPAIPVKFIKLLLPLGTKVKNFNLRGVPIEIDTTNIDLVDNPVLPYQDPIPIGNEIPKKLVIDDSIYHSLNSYPSAMYGEQNIGYCKGYTIFSFSVNPVQYIPGTGKIFYYPEITITIELEKNNYINRFFRNNLEDEKWVEKLVYNPEIINTYQTDIPVFEYSGGLCDPGNDYDYVIITTTQNNLDDWQTNSTVPYNWSSLIDKHESDDGFNCTLVTIEDINTCSDYWNDTTLFNDTVTQIREFCKDAYQDWGTSYIFVGGDAEWIPARLMNTSFETDIDSDLYWSNLDLTFNDDNDSSWGEEDDNGFDLYAELYIGRITCDTPQDVSNWMNKSFNYADSEIQDYLDNAAFYGGDTNWECEGDDFIDYSAIKGTNDWLGPDPDSDGPFPSWLGFQYGFETWNNENPGKEFNLSAKWTAEPPNDGWQGGDDSTAIEGLKTAINNDQVTFISAIAHANQYYSMDVHYTNWESEYHNTKPFFVHDYGCHCGDMDAADDGVLHSMLFHSDTELAFACVYNTGYGWGNDYSTNSSSSLQQKCFWDYFFDLTNNSIDPINWQLGKAMAFSKDTMSPTINWDFSWRSIIQGCLLFGDPAQRIKPPVTYDHNVGVQTLITSNIGLSKPNEVIYVNATVYNSGENSETNVLVNFSVNGSFINSTNISSFESYTNYPVSFNWTPSAGSYTVIINITIPEVIENTYSDNEKNETIYVGVKNINNDKLFNTIQTAIDDNNTTDGHSILVPYGNYQENITVNKNISLMGSSEEGTIIEPNGSSTSVINIQNKDDVNITDLTIRNCDYGINITNSLNISITNCNISNSTIMGIYLNASENITIINNDIFYNGIGIQLTNNSENNGLIENEIIGNSIGFIIESENNNNSIYHNNFNNTYNSFDNGSNNIWDNGYLEEYRLRGGNWWSDYIGSDANGDSIGDTPYNILGTNNSEDRYPLIEQWTGSLSGTIYVDDNNIAGPWYGTQDYPFQIIQDAIENASNGDKIFVYNGTYIENIIIDKSINLTGENKNTTIIDANKIGNVININADWVNLSCFTIQNSGITTFNCLDWMNLTTNSTLEYFSGVVVSSNYITIKENVIMNNSFGVFWLEELYNNNISYNFLINNTYYDIVIGYSFSNIVIDNNLTTNSESYGITFGYSNDNTIVGNIISNHTDDGGIEIFSSLNNTISSNILINNSVGIEVTFSSDNNIFENNITDNIFGISLYDSFDNNIIDNNFTNNLYGIYLDWSDNNVIYHNNFVNNIINAYDENSNTWDNGSISGGNYWSDFNEPNENAYDNNNDGIVDSPYDISGGNNQDRYPVTGFWGERPNQPVCISPSDGTTGVPTSLTLNVRVTDPNNDSIDVSFYNVAGNSLIGTDTDILNGDIASVSWSDLSYSTSYNWYVIVNDSTYLTRSYSWSFTTESTSYAPPPGGTPGAGVDTTAPSTPNNASCLTAEKDNTPSFSWDASTDSSGIAGYYIKIDDNLDTWIGNVSLWNSSNNIEDGVHTFYVKAKDASLNGNIGNYGTCLFTIDTSVLGNKPIVNAGGPYYGLTYENLIFTGLASYDTDGTITNYTWNLGDGTIIYGGKITHSYNTPGVFNITLTIIDNDGLSNSNRTTVTIELDSDSDGWSDAEEINYNTNTTNPNDFPIDIDKDKLPDDYDEDDDNDGLVDYLEETWGSDPKNDSDVIIINLEGSSYYLIDTNDDGISDKFCNPVGRITNVEMTDDHNYLIDMEGDGKWDYIYNPASGEIKTYEKKSSDEFPWILILVGIVIAIIAIIIIFYFAGYRLWVEKY